MKFTSLIRCVLAFAGAFLLSSCGGGGAAVVDATPPTTLSVQPASATWYAGVLNTLTIGGGTAPFTMTSSEPSLLAVPQSTSNRVIEVVPNNPSVVDAGLPPEALPVRTVIVSVRDALGNSVSSEIKVGQNFLTGYGFSFRSTTCASGGPCAGGESVVTFDATLNGNIRPNRVFRIEKIRGPWQFVDPLNSNNQVDAVTVTSDEHGRFTAIIRVAANSPTQVGVFKITDVATGTYVIDNFNISGTPATGALTVLPDTINLTGTGPNQCGFGDVDVLVFDGVAPYSAVCPNPQIVVKNSPSNTQPGRITFTIGPNGGTCLTGEQCVVTDNTGARAIVTINTTKGAAPPSSPLSVVPNSITLACGTSGSVTVAGGTSPSGGTPNYGATSTHPRVQASASGNIVTITRLANDAASPPVPVGGYPATATVSVTDGSTAVPVTVTITGMVGGVCP